MMIMMMLKMMRIMRMTRMRLMRRKPWQRSWSQVKQLYLRIITNRNLHNHHLHLSQNHQFHHTTITISTSWNPALRRHTVGPRPAWEAAPAFRKYFSRTKILLSEGKSLSSTLPWSWIFLPGDHFPASSVGACAIGGPFEHLWIHLNKFWKHLNTLENMPEICQRYA